MATAVIRLPGLRALPIFGDEAIHLHWAQLIREDPMAFAFVSLQAPKPPMHSWLLAIGFPLSSDPVLAGRLLGVLFAALTAPFLFLLCWELVTALGEGSALSAKRSAIASGVFFALCPYLSLHQRLAMVEPLFFLEATAAAWLSLKISGSAASPKTSVALGLWMGAAMLTRQDVSYLLWALPIFGFLMRTRENRDKPGRFLFLLAGSAALSVLVWAPMLFVRQGPDLFERLFHSRLLVEPMQIRDRLAMVVENTIAIAGWLWTYLTPPLCIFAIAAFPWLWRRRQRRLAAFLGGWLFLTLAPLILFGRFLFSRYGIVAVLPLLLAAGAVLGQTQRHLDSKTGWLRRDLASVLLVAAFVAWPLYAIALQATRWKEQPLVPLDRWQFVSGWPAGYATEQAVDVLRNLARKEPIVLLIPRNEGNPMDTLWLDFGCSPSIHSFSTGDVFTEPLLRRSAAGADLLADVDPRRRQAPRGVTIPAEMPVYTLSPNPILTREGLVPAATVLSRLNPQIRETARFWNPSQNSEPPTDGVVLYRIR